MNRNDWRRRYNTISLLTVKTETGGQKRIDDVIQGKKYVKYKLFAYKLSKGTISQGEKNVRVVQYPRTSPRL